MKSFGHKTFLKETQIHVCLSDSAVVVVVDEQSWPTVRTPSAWSSAPGSSRSAVRRSSCRSGTRRVRSASEPSRAATTEERRERWWCTTSPGTSVIETSLWGGDDGDWCVCVRVSYRRSTYNHLSSWLTDARNLTNPNTVSLSLAWGHDVRTGHTETVADLQPITISDAPLLYITMARHWW